MLNDKCIILNNFVYTQILNIGKVEDLPEIVVIKHQIKADWEKRYN